jgi:thiosulfate/3-mercaptopyruvate sulfurtransferase
MKRLLSPDEIPTDAVLLDARPQAQYFGGHIPGAHQADLAQAFMLRSQEGLERFHQELARLLGAAGLKAGQPVVAYDNGPETLAARAAFLAEYAGLEAAMLRGGLPAWVAAGRPLERGPGEWQPTTVEVRPRPGTLATTDDVLEAVRNGAVIVDARAPEEYRGEKAPPNMPRRGRVPGSLNFEWKRVTDSAGLLDDGALEPALRSLPRSGEVIVYCQSGARSAVLYQALKHLGVPARNYLGSAGEWLSDASLPLESGPGTEL